MSKKQENEGNSHFIIAECKNNRIPWKERENDVARTHLEDP